MSCGTNSFCHQFVAPVWYSADIQYSYVVLLLHPEQTDILYHCTPTSALTPPFCRYHISISICWVIRISHNIKTRQLILISMPIRYSSMSCWETLDPDIHADANWHKPSIMLFTSSVIGFNFVASRLMSVQAGDRVWWSLKKNDFSRTLKLNAGWLSAI